MSKGQKGVEPIVNWSPKRTIKDETVLVFRNSKLPLNNGMHVVLGLGDARKNKYKLSDKGYRHIATLSASAWIEMLLSKDSDGVVDMVDNIDS